MKKQVIAVDVDDVLASSAQGWVDFSNKKWGTNLTVDDYNEDWAKMWGVDREEEKIRAKAVYDAVIIKDFKHHDAALPVLTKLSKKYELVIATSHIQAMHKETLEWLDKHYKGIFSGFHGSGLFDVLTDTSHKGTKADLVKRIGADYLIDDQSKHCLAVADLGIETILFGDYGWNRDIGPLPPRVTRCFDWAAVEEYFDGRA
jgi:5'(3')-deoxyribonucleotidase